MNVKNLKKLVITLEKVVAFKANFDLTIFQRDSMPYPTDRSVIPLTEWVECGAICCALGWYAADHGITEIVPFMKKHFSLPDQIHCAIFGLVPDMTEIWYGKRINKITAQDVIDQLNKLISNAEETNE